MFESARLKLTAWYLLIIMLISIFFSVAFYHASTREIEWIINRIEYRQRNPGKPMPNKPQPPHVSSLTTVEDLEDSKKQILNSLILINGFIFVVAGSAGYFLAGRTLRPIKLMIEEQNQFITSSSHELRTPIATMRAEMEGSLMETHITEKQARKLIHSNLEELGSLQTLTNNLLKLSNIPNANNKKHMEEITLQEIIEAARKKVMSLAKMKNISISTKVQDIKIKGDKSRLIEVFVILFDNAIKYSSEKTKISVKSEAKPHSVTVSITDQGVGITDTDLPYIFDRFYRADKSRSLTDGYGLGLSIARKIIETHNGTISVSSEKNHGTTFVLQFPLKHT